MRIDPIQPVNIVGAGLAGALLALLLGRRGQAVRLYDRRPDPRRTQAESGRSINLALAARGSRALERAGIMDRIRPLLIPMRGRMIHEISGATALQPYGQQEHEVIYCVGRAALNRALIEETARHRNVALEFGQTCIAADPSMGLLRFRDEATGVEHEVELTPTIAADGAGSAVRSSLASAGYLEVREDWLDHDYKELTLPPVHGRHAMEPHALHIWPRGGFMLIALPNTDGSFTATLFLARTGPRSFAELTDSAAVLEFFRREFPDAVPLIPDLPGEFHAHPAGRLGTVHANPWQADGRVVLLGDAAHAIVPFHGQGMNAAFEDCFVLDSLLEQHHDWPSLLTAFETTRRPNTEAIAHMALENYTEMRDTVLDAAFARRKALALQLERRFPDRFIPRYAMVTFHPEIPYAQALHRGAVQAQILAELDPGADSGALAPSVAGAGSGEVDFALAERLINERLPPLSRA
jgi:kynurenine 3-monooxygenase